MARHRYVASNGSDANPGSAALPFKSIARAARSALPGTIIHVAPGTYPGGFKTTASGTAAARIHFVSTVRWGARIVPPAESANSTAWDNRGDFVDIVGFDIDGAGARGGIAWLHGDLYRRFPCRDPRQPRASHRPGGALQQRGQFGDQGRRLTTGSTAM